MHRNDVTGRVIGLLTFLLGIALLVFVAVLAYTFFAKTSLIPPPVKGSVAPITNRLGESAVRLVADLVLLIVMAAVGSLLASKGIHLYWAASGQGSGRQGGANIDAAP